MLKSNRRMMPETKPLWYWDDSVKRYRSPVTGRFIGIDDMNGLRAEFMESQKERVEGVTNVYAAEAIDFKTYRNQVTDIIRQTYVDLYAMGAGGRNNLTAKDWGSIGGMLKEQYGYLNPFMDQIEAGELSQAQITVRLKMYINSASEAFWRAFARDIPIDLPHYPGDGSTACLTNCQCRWDIQFVPGVGYNCYWILGEAENCDDCIARTKEYNPYFISITGEPSDAS